jgi:N-formylglutamate deformylase
VTDLQAQPSRLVLHVPHASKTIPDSLRPNFVLSDDALALEVMRKTDSYTDELFADPAAAMIRFPVSRLVLDPERFLDDSVEIMAPRGFGVIYIKTSDLKQLRNAPTAEERAELIDRYYRPHHSALEAAVDQAVAEHGECVVIDCHSFPDIPHAYELRQNPDRPDLCIGSDEFHTPSDLVKCVANKAGELGLSVAENDPFAGALVPMSRYEKDPAVFGIMLEINRRLYMDEASGLKSSGFDLTRERINELIATISSWRRG